MSEFDLTQEILGGIVTYGAPMVTLVILLGAFGLPLPGTLVVIASGAFLRQGYLSAEVVGYALVAVMLGDTAVYLVGRFAGVWANQRWAEKPLWQHARQQFNQRGGIAIYTTRWLFTPIAIPTNLIAGTSHYPFWRFLFFDLSGETTWLLLYGGLGYAFGSQWELISEFISNFTGVLLGILALGVGVYLLWYLYQRPENGSEIS